MSLVNGEVRISDINKNLGVVELSKPEYGVAPGQACVFYDRKKKMIGGGWISASEKQNNQSFESKFFGLDFKYYPLTLKLE